MGVRREVRRGWWTNGLDGIVLRGIRPHSGRLARLGAAARSSGGGGDAEETMWSKLARVVVNRPRSPLSRIAVSLVGGCLVLRRLAAVHGSLYLQQGVFGLALADLELAYLRSYLPVLVPRCHPVGIVDFLSHSSLYEFIGARRPEFKEPSGWNYADQGPGRGGGFFPDVLHLQPVYCPFDFAGVCEGDLTAIEFYCYLGLVVFQYF